jgi:hypothetical protein
MCSVTMSFYFSNPLGSLISKSGSSDVSIIIPSSKYIPSLNESFQEGLKTLIPFRVVHMDNVFRHFHSYVSDGNNTRTQKYTKHKLIRVVNKCFMCNISPERHMLDDSAIYGPSAHAD